MENFKFVLFSIIVLGALGFAGYWAFSTIESGSYHVNREKQEQMIRENEELKKENTDLKKNFLCWKKKRRFRTRNNQKHRTRNTSQRRSSC